MSAKTEINPEAHLDLPAAPSDFDLELAPVHFGVVPVCSKDTARRFGIELGLCAVSEATDGGILAVQITGGTCREIRSCLLGIGAVGDSIACKLKSSGRPKAAPRPRVASRQP